MRRLATAVVLLSLVAAMLSTGGCQRSLIRDPGVEPTQTVSPSQPTSATEPTSASLPEADEAVEPNLAWASVSVYFLAAEKVAPATRNVRAPAVATAALRKLLEGPDETEAEQGLTSSIPVGTKLRSVKIANGTATVDLTSEFESGGGTLSMTTRVAQVVYTLTQFKTVQRVAFRIEGTPVQALGGEGIVIDEPQTRSDWEDAAPSILLERPAWGDAITRGQTAQYRGTANVFEGVFFLELIDGDGRIVATKRVQASSGTGTRGTFSAFLRMPRTAKLGWGSIVASYDSPKDGSRVVLSEVPLEVKRTP